MSRPALLEREVWPNAGKTFDHIMMAVAEAAAELEATSRLIAIASAGL